MIYLLTVTIIWAFSFGLIKNQLTNLDSNFVAFVRMGISLLVFLPFLRIRKLDTALGFKLVLTGAIQYGVMYLSYIYAFQFLQAYQIALFTIFTPLYITLINDLLSGKFHRLFFSSAVFCILGTGVIIYKDAGLQEVQIGFLLVQLSNISFALGQVLYKRLLKPLPEIKDTQIFALLYLGAFIITSLFSGFTTSWSALTISGNQLFTLIYLGAIASGLGFYLWNVGARRTNIGTLAIFNNIKIPLAILVALLFFSEQADVLRLTVGSLIIFSTLFANEYFVYKKSVNNRLL